MPDDPIKNVLAPHLMPLCDMVMEGGVTSGVIYPKAATALSKEFRLKNIGGTSVGALAAAVAAAAEVGRARDPVANPGYARLAQLPEELQARGFSDKRATRLFDLFQPQPATRPLFNILASTLNRKSKVHILGHAVRASVMNFAPIFVGVTAALLLALSVAGTNGWVNWLVAVLFSTMVGIAGVAYALWRRVTGALVENGFGICTGYLEGIDQRVAPRDVHEPLTLWLSRLINESAGKAADGPPLTFGELWRPTADARSLPPAWLQESGVQSWRYVDLQMISTNVTHRRPYRFPYDDDDQNLFFKPAELRKWFPQAVIDHMVATAADYAAHRKDQQPESLPDGLLMLPQASDMPVVFAARLSLSFPFLLSAVPLYALDYEAQDPSLHQFERCWFSDGGICSNFPIHFFDSPLPLWPTVGIKLEAERRYRPIDGPAATAGNRSFLPDHNESGRGDTIARFDGSDKAASRLLGFISAILDSARHWQSHMLVRAPGVRDRVLRIYLKKNEGGLNLNMPPEVLQTLTKVGEDGAAALGERFRPGSADPMNFDNHRWVRVRNLTAVLENDMSSIHTSLLAAVPLTRSWQQLLAGATSRTGRDQYQATDEQSRKIEAMVEQLRSLSKVSGAQPDLLQEKAPRRTPTVRIVPNI